MSSAQGYDKINEIQATIHNTIFQFQYLRMK